jgi:hypothetical protein
MEWISGTRSRLESEICALNLLLFTTTATYLTKHPKLRIVFAYGLVSSLLISTLLLATQILSPSLSFPNLTRVWRSLGQLPGGYSDPNAAGIMGFLILPLFFSLKPKRTLYRALLFCSGLPTVFLLTATGSRCYLLGGTLLLFAFLYFKWRNGAWVMLFTFSALVLLLQFTPLPTVLSFLPPGKGIERVIKSLHFSQVGEALYSRLIFNRISWEIIIDNFLFGIGFGNYRRELLPYSQQAGIDLRGWSDNANNFYLGIVAEGGFLALSLLIYSFHKLRCKSNVTLLSPLGVSALIFLFLLLFGPHLNFTEVSLGASLPFSYLFTRDRVTHYFSIFTTLALTFIALVWSYSFQEYGFSAYRHSKEGLYRRASRYAKGIIKCQDNGNVTLRVKGQREGTLKLGKELFMIPKEGDLRAYTVSCYPGSLLKFVVKVSLSEARKSRSRPWFFIVEKG